MKELLDRPSTEFGLYFLMFPLGFLSGSFVATRLSGKISNETMVFIGSAMSLSVVVTQSAFLLAGHVSPLVLFLPGFFITLAQGMSLPFGQAGAISVDPQLAGMAAGIGVFMQNFCGAAFAQLYGFLADGTPGALMMTTAISGCLSVAVAAIPLAMSLERDRIADRGQRMREVRDPGQRSAPGCAHAVKSRPDRNAASRACGGNAGCDQGKAAGRHKNCLLLRKV